MAIYALENIDDALDATRSFLWPIDRSRWVKLALVVFFLGGPATNFPNAQFNVPANGGQPPAGIPPEITPRLLFLVGAVVLVGILIGLVFLLIGSIMEFVLVESIRREEVAVRQFWGERWRQGVRLFGFRLVIGLIVFGSAAVLVGLFLFPWFVQTGTGPAAPAGGLSVVALLFALPVIVALSILVGLVSGFTTVFVVPIMVLEDCGVLEGWRRLWPTITANPWQYLAYAVAGFFLTIAAGVLVAIVVGIVAVLLLIPFGVLGAIGYGLWTVAPPLGVGVLAVVGLLFVVSILIALALVQVPVVVYLRYYALLVLGDVDAALDLIPDRRSAIRD